MFRVSHNLFSSKNFEYMIFGDFWNITLISVCESESMVKPGFMDLF